MTDGKKINWHSSGTWLPTMSRDAQGKIDQGEYADIFHIEDEGGEIGHVLKHAIQKDMSSDAKEDGLDYVRIAGGKGEDVDWAMDVAPGIAQKWYDDGKPTGNTE